MGIDFSHCDASWAYSGFARFRKKLAHAIGFPEYETISNTNDARFDKIKKDPLIYLLAHSDCDGHITPARCRKLAPRLREILSNWSDQDIDKARGLRLCEGLEDAGQANERLEFT